MLHNNYIVLPRGYEPLTGYTGYRMLDRHPSGRYTAREAIGSARGPAAAVWDTQTGSIVYAPHPASLIGWLNSGSDVMLVRDTVANSGAPDTLQGNGEGGTYFERRTWPKGELISSCRLTLYSGWPHSLVVSPHGNLA